MRAALAIVCVPRAKAEARALMAEAMGADLIVVDGQKTDGVEALLKDCKALGLAVGEALSKAHGKLAMVDTGAGTWRLGGETCAG